MERRLRIDLIIALTAVAISAIAAGAAAYQTYVVNKQFSATVWPYLSITATYNVDRVTLAIENDGLGPAIVRTAALKYDGRTVARWSDWIKTFPFPHGTHLAGSLQSISSGEVIRAGDAKTVLDLHGRMPGPGVLTGFERAHQVSIDLCYCSLLDQCWNVRMMAEDSNPHPVSACSGSEAVDNS